MILDEWREFTFPIKVYEKYNKEKRERRKETGGFL